MNDPVNHPAYYTKGGIECIDAIEAATVGKACIEAVCVANVIKYLWRYEAKNGLQDVQKARWYLDRLISALEPEIAANAFQINTIKPSNAPAWSDDPKWQWMAQDLNGTWVAFTHKPFPAQLGIWRVDGTGEAYAFLQGTKNPNWRTTLRQRQTPTTNAGPMLHYPDCSAEHCPCVAR